MISASNNGPQEVLLPPPLQQLTLSDLLTTPKQERTAHGLKLVCSECGLEIPGEMAQPSRGYDLYCSKEKTAAKWVERPIILQ